ncbi:hypothetical protein IQ259_01250 [Fortiea sp. LEGE XX443]|nr:hypothetical protein [Fortiea sp. LEGE XX443]
MTFFSQDMSFALRKVAFVQTTAISAFNEKLIPRSQYFQVSDPCKAL